MLSGSRGGNGGTCPGIGWTDVMPAGDACAEALLQDIHVPIAPAQHKMMLTAFFPMSVLLM
jgi:hypothetical protein